MEFIADYVSGLTFVVMVALWVAPRFWTAVRARLFRAALVDLLVGCFYLNVAVVVVTGNYSPEWMAPLLFISLLMAIVAVIYKGTLVTQIKQVTALRCARLKT